MKEALVLVDETPEGFSVELYWCPKCEGYWVKSGLNCLVYHGKDNCCHQYDLKAVIKEENGKLLGKAVSKAESQSAPTTDQ